MSRKVDVFAQGRRYRLGRTPEYGGIWRKRPWGWRLVSRYALTDEGWAAAQQQMAMWEPRAGTSVSKSEPGHRRRRWILGAVLVALVGSRVALAVTDHGSPQHSTNTATHQFLGSTTTEGKPVGTGYLATGDGFVAFIQWNDNDGNLSGTFQDVTTTGTPPNMSTSSNTVSLTGTLSGSSISVTFQGQPATFGTISGGSFTLNVPQSDGMLAPLTFNSATPTAYNSAVASLNQQIDQDKQQAANAEALQAEEQQIDSDATAVSNDIAGLSKLEASTNTDVQDITPDLQHEGTDLAATQTAEQQVAGEAGSGNSGQVCGDAAGVSGDAAGVSGDAAAVSGDAASVESDLTGPLFGSGIRPSVTILNSDFAKLHSDEGQLPGYVPASAPSASDVSQAVAGANAAVRAALSATNADIDQANADVTAAYQLAAQAYQAGGCGSAPAAPAAIQHIS